MKRQLLVGFALVAYCILLIKVMVFKDVPSIRIGSLMLNFAGTNAGHAPNFTPFKTILWYLHGGHGMIIGGVNILGNILLLVPIGFLVPLMELRLDWKRLLALGIVISFAIESLQVLLKVGIFDIDDVLLNTLGVMIGYWAYLLLAHWSSRGQYGRMVIAMAVVVLLAAAAFYSFFPATGQQPHLRNVGEMRMPEENNKNKTAGFDLCNGTGGTGKIISVGNRSITLRRNDGELQTVKLTARTMFRNSSGIASRSMLKAGQRITIVIDDSETAGLVLICNTGI